MGSGSKVKIGGLVDTTYMGMLREDEDGRMKAQGCVWIVWVCGEWELHGQAGGHAIHGQAR